MKHTMTDKARRRIEVEVRKTADPANSWGCIVEAVKGEDFQDADYHAAQLVKTWIRAGSDKILRYISAEAFNEIHHERNRYRDAGRDIAEAIKTFS